jgi:hypothetical protein
MLSICTVHCAGDLHKCIKTKTVKTKSFSSGTLLSAVCGSPLCTAQRALFLGIWRNLEHPLETFKTDQILTALDVDGLDTEVLYDSLSVDWTLCV